MTGLSGEEEDSVQVWEVDLVTWADGTKLVRVLFEVNDGLQSYILRSHDGVDLAALDLEEHTFQARPFQGKECSEYMNITLFTREGEGRRSRLSDLPFHRARGLLVSALCEVLFQGRAPDLRWPALHALPLMLPPLTMKTLEEGLKLLFEPGTGGLFDPRDAHQKITMVLPSVGLPKLTRVSADYRALETHEVVSCAWSEPVVRHAGHHAGPSASNETYEGPSASTHVCERVQIWLPTHGDTISLETLRFVLEGSFTGPAPAWSVRWIATDPDPDRPFERVVVKDEVLAEGCPTPLQALEGAGLVRLDSPEVQQAWIDQALTSWSEPTWMPGLQDAIAPGRLMGSDPLFIRGDADFLAWVRAAGLEHLARRVNEGPPIQIHWSAP